MDQVVLPPELERFAANAVAEGRYRDVADVAAAGLSLLRQQEQARADLIRTLEEVEAEGERDDPDTAARLDLGPHHHAPRPPGPPDRRGEAGEID